MTSKWMKKMQVDVGRLIRENKNDYAETFALCDRDSLAFIEVSAVVAWAGFTPTSFMVAWAVGSFDE